MGYKEEFIEFMVRSQVLTFGDFVTKSGRKTPYFINTGNYKTSEQISKLGDYYAACAKNDVRDNFNLIYGPAYKGIPLAVTTSIALYRNYGMNIAYCFNRKEQKDHGEGGTVIGAKPVDTDKILIVEDVITSGLSVRESMALLRAICGAEVSSLIISVDRMEKGNNKKTAVQEMKEEFGINVYPIVNIREILEYLHNREVDGKIIIDDNMADMIKKHLDING